MVPPADLCVVRGGDTTSTFCACLRSGIGMHCNFLLSPGVSPDVCVCCYVTNLFPQATCILSPGWPWIFVRSRSVIAPFSRYRISSALSTVDSLWAITMQGAFHERRKASWTNLSDPVSRDDVARPAGAQARPETAWQWQSAAVGRLIGSYLFVPPVNEPFWQLRTKPPAWRWQVLFQRCLRLGQGQQLVHDLARSPGPFLKTRTRLGDIREFGPPGFQTRLIDALTFHHYIP